MLKLAQAGADGAWNVFLGITVENLDRLGTKLEPIVFPAEQIGLGAGSFAVGTTGMGAALREQLGREELRACLELTQEDADALVSGAPVERSLESLGFSRPGLVLVLLGATEAGMLASLRSAGLVTDATKVTEVTAAPARARRRRPATRRRESETETDTKTPVALAPRTRIKPSLVLSGLVLIGVGAIGVAAAKNTPLAFLLVLAGLAVVVWGFRHTPPRAR